MRTVRCPSCSRAKSRGGSGKTSTNGVKGNVSDDALITSGPRSGWTAEYRESYFLGPSRRWLPVRRQGAMPSCTAGAMYPRCHERTARLSDRPAVLDLAEAGSWSDRHPWSRRGDSVAAPRSLSPRYERPSASPARACSGRGVGASGTRRRERVTLALLSKAVAARTASGSGCGAPADAVAGSSELESGGGGHHRCAPGVDGCDDLFGVDALQVDRGRAEVGVAELALDHVERHALTRELDGVGVAQLVWREAVRGYGSQPIGNQTPGPRPQRASQRRGPVPRRPLDRPAAASPASDSAPRTRQLAALAGVVISALARRGRVRQDANARERSFVAIDEASKRHADDWARLRSTGGFAAVGRAGLGDEHRDEKRAATRVAPST